MTALRLFALARADFLLGHRLFRAGQDAVEVEFRLLDRGGLRRTRAAALRQAGDRRALLAVGAVLLGLGRLGGHERDRRAVQVERDAERHREAEQHPYAHAREEIAAFSFAHHIFSGALTPISDSPLASVWRTAAQSASRAVRSASSSTRMRSAL